MTKIHIKNGLLVDPINKIHESKDIIVEDGKVSQLIPSNSQVSDAEIIDASGCVVAPGFIDIHVHLREPGYEYKETIETGTNAAAAGGFTSICCMANTNPVNDAASVTDYILKKAKDKGVVNVFPIGALTKGLEGQELSQIGELKEAGCVGLSDDGRCVDNAMVMRTAMEYARSFNLPVLTHSICPCLSGDGVMNEGYLSTKLGLPGIPHQAEDVMIGRDICLSELTGARLHICHVATKGGVDLIRLAKKKGLPVTAEVAPHHFTLTDESVVGYCTDAKMSPPLRSDSDCEALIEGLADGTIDAIATDHAPHAEIDKEVEFDRAANGIVGLETALSLSLKLVEAKHLTLDRMIEALTSAPAKIMGLDKGTLSIGADADIVIFDPAKQYIIDPSTFRSKSKNTPFGGMEVRGRVKWTLVNGNVMYSDES